MKILFAASLGFFSGLLMLFLVSDTGTFYRSPTKHSQESLFSYPQMLHGLTEGPRVFRCWNPHLELQLNSCAEAAGDHGDQLAKNGCETRSLLEPNRGCGTHTSRFSTVNFYCRRIITSCASLHFSLRDTESNLSVCPLGTMKGNVCSCAQKCQVRIYTCVRF